MTPFEIIFYIILCISYYVFCYSLTYTTVSNDDDSVMMIIGNIVLTAALCMLTTSIIIDTRLADKLE